MAGMKSSLATLALIACTACLAAPAPVISNRPPQPGEVGYRPADGGTVLLNPPTFTWLHETGAVTYTLEYSTELNLTKAATVMGLPWNTHTPGKTLEPGAWYWRYCYQTRDKTVSGWSQIRSVNIPTNAIDFPMPDTGQQQDRVPEGHPRLFMRPDDLPRLRELASGREAQRFARLRTEADRVMAAGPTPEPAHLGSAREKDNDELVKYWWPNREQTMKACQEAEVIAFVYLITQEPKYKEAARKWILHLASWDPDGPTNFKLNCEAGKPMLYRLPRAYDWGWDSLSEQDREKVQQVMVRRVRDAWNSGEIDQGTGHLNRPYNSHGNRIWHKVGEAGIAFLREVPEANRWLDYAVNKFYSSYPVWSDDDGGWHEGVSYWAGYMGKAVWWLQVAQSSLQIDGLKKPFFSHVGDYPLYIAPPNSPNAGFGDLSFRPLSPTSVTFMEYFVRMQGSQPGGTQAGYWRWWMDQLKTKPESGILGFLYAANLPGLPPAKAPTDLPPSKVFQGIGVASLHTTLLDSRDDVHFLLKSSPFGSQSHGHNPQNTFLLNAYGEALLTACGYRDLHGSKFHYDYVHSTRAQNGVLVNGQGQVKHSGAATGRIAASRLTPEWDWIVGDAPEAYGKLMTRCQRQVLFVKPDCLVLYDDLVAREPATFQFMLHALKSFTVDTRQGRVRVDQPNAGVEAQYLSPLPLVFQQTDGFKPAPKKEFPNQWHVEAGTTNAQAGLGMLTVLVPYRTGQATTWQAARVESPTAIGIEFTRNGQKRVLGFRKYGITGTATLAGQGFAGPVLVSPAK
jgi:hypothetical protein